MNHVHEGVLQAWLDGELTASERSGVAEHLQGCLACRDHAAELRAAAERLGAALAFLDTAPPATLAAPRRRRSFATAFGGGLARAAGLVLLLAGGAAALIPGSPVRSLIVDAWRSLGAPVDTVVEAPPAEPVQEEIAARGGVAVTPVDGAVRVNLVAPSSDVHIRVQLVDAEQAEVDAERTGPAYGLTGGRGWIHIAGIEAGRVTVQIPRSVHTATVEVDGRVLVRKVGDRLVPAPQSGTGPDVEVLPGG
ncbi:MAG: zf-HC2 domain-containing protein [Gemmatimonadota bacterium]